MIKAALFALAWQVALPGWQYEFPRDHGNHPSFKTEWWYFTGNLRAKGKRDFGYQLTFFRQGVLFEKPPNVRSRFITDNLKLAHFAVSDLAQGKFFFGQSLSRGAFGEAGFSNAKYLAWIDKCSLEFRPDGTFHLIGRDGQKSIDLTLRSNKDPVIHGEKGVSQKADGVGRASHYYSLTRLSTVGTITIGEQSFAVEGLSWFDHEWATNQLAKYQIGWDWFSVQFDDGSELMLFQLRTKNKERDSWSGGSWIAANGQITRISNSDFTLEPLENWKSSVTNASYPIRWHIRIPKIGVDVEVSARMPDQELKLSSLAYWEGAITATGIRKNQKIRGQGYLEMTGYSGPVVGLQASDEKL